MIYAAGAQLGTICAALIAGDITELFDSLYFAIVAVEYVGQVLAVVAAIDMLSAKRNAALPLDMSLANPDEKNAD